MSTLIDVFTELQCVSTTIWRALEENKTQNLKAKEFRIIINCYKKLQTIPTSHTETLTQLSDRLFQVLTSGSLNMDCQIVASTAYCLVLTHHHDHETIFSKITNVLLTTDIESLEKESLTIHEFNNNKKYDMFKICFCHGILQCDNNFWFRPINNLSVCNLLNNEIFPVVCKLCFGYNTLCLISFKVLVNLIKKINTINQDVVRLTDTNFKEIMNIVMSNWENQLSGIREQNLLVFEQLLIANKNCWQQVSEDLSLSKDTSLCPLLPLILSEESWMMKSKYFLLSAVLRIYGVQKTMAPYEEDIIAGLMLSLKFSQLVSAGSDLYQVITSAIPLDQWENIFLTPISEALCQSSNMLLTENVINYWLPYTVKQFPSSLPHLLEKITADRNNVNLFSYISLMKLARKEGFDVANWDVLKRSSLLVPGLLSDCDKTRSQAFHLICVSSKLSVPPSDEEIKLVKMFLHQNVNIDNAAMRQHLLNAFVTFVIRMRDSSLKEIRKRKMSDSEMSHSVDKCLNFLEWLHAFIIKNFQFDCNYQRKFTSLQIYRIVLNYFCNKLKAIDLRRVVENCDINIISNNRKWKFTSKESQNILINNIYDPADDIKTMSAEILILYFNIEESEIIYYKELLQNALKVCKNPMFYQAESGALLLQTVITLMSNSTYCVKEDIFHNVFSDSKTVLDYLIQSVSEQFEDFSKDMLQAVVNGSSLYGLLNALERLFAHPSSSEYQILSDEQIERIIALIEDIISLLLKVLSAKSDTSSDFAPSFAEMGMAIVFIVQQSSVSGEDIQNSQLIDCDGNESILEDLQLTPAQQLVLNCIWHNMKQSSVSGEDIQNSQLIDCDGNESILEDLQLTPAQQLVLNCIWHNMKVCCSIASKLITTSRLNVNNTKHCMDLLCLVLCKCRHKGAIESAGFAIYQATKFLTSSDKFEFRNIPRELILQFLSSLVSANSTTISRRSAGLAILIHRIAAGDMELGKPLLHICVARFMKVFDNFKEPIEATLVDLPHSRALHFLQSLVQDSSLRQEMAKYINQISLLCFVNLGSSIWTLRNAALQLFGALLPKLTGQKKVQEGETQSDCYHLAIEELYFHLKPLFEMIINELSTASTTSSLQIHSTTMPLLTLLSQLTVSFQSFLNTELHKIRKHFSRLFQCLFRSEIYNVRELSAKCNAWFCLPSEILHLIQDKVKDIICYVTKNQSTITNNNELHGYLLNIKYFVSRFNETKTGNKTLQGQEEMLKSCVNELQVVTKSSHHSVIYNVIFEILKETNIKSYLNISEVTKSIKVFPAVSGNLSWAEFNLQCFINNCDSENLENILKQCISSGSFDIRRVCLSSLKNRIKTNRIKTRYYSDIFGMLNNVLQNSNCKSQIIEFILEIMLEILYCEDTAVNVNIDDAYFNIVYNLKYGSKCSIIALPIICGIINKQSSQFSFVDKLCSEIFKRSSPIYNEDLRMSSAKSLLFIFPILKSICDYSDSVGSNVWKTAVNLLRDEDKDIRIEVSKHVLKYLNVEFDKWIICEYKLCSTNLTTINNCNPFVVLQFLFNTTSLKEFMSEKNAVLTMLEMLIRNDNTSVSKNDADILNPFYNDKNNIYEEEVVLVDLIQSSILSLLKTLNEEDLLKVKIIILDKVNLAELDLMRNTKSKIALKFKRLECQAQIVNTLMERKLCD